MKKTKNTLIFFISVLFFFACEDLDDSGNFSNSAEDSLGISNDTDFEQPSIERYTEFGENNFISVSEQPVSTFSVDADGASYANTRRFLNLEQNPPVAAVRVEEYLNYFTFDYQEPEGEENVSLNTEFSNCPWDESHYLLRVGMKGKTIPEAELPDANYVFLIDVSGSMSAPEKLELLKTGFKSLVDEMRDTDRIAIVTYAGSAGLLLDTTFGDEKEKIKNAIDQLGAGGSTAGAEGILTAYQIAEDNFIINGNNRIILGTDGDFNVGPIATEDLVALVEEKRETGIYLTVLGVGTGNLNEASMEQFANRGNGNYEYIDNVQQLQKVFVNEKSKFYAVATDSKIQITFDGDQVNAYRLIGYENRALNEDDFEDDSVDAGEIGSGQTITALYELVMQDGFTQGSIANFDFRYKKPNSISSHELSLDVVSSTNAISEASQNQRFAAAVAGFGLLMKESEFKGNTSKAMILDLLNGATNFDDFGYKAEFKSLVELAQ